MSAMGAGYVVLPTQCLTDADGDRLLPHVQVGQARHQGARVQIVDLILEQTYRNHLPVHLETKLFTYRMIHSCDCHVGSAAILASTSNTTAKSLFAMPIPRAAVRNSLLTAVVGNGTLSWRPSSIASSMSFCIMLTSNQA